MPTQAIGGVSGELCAEADKEVIIDNDDRERRTDRTARGQ